MKCSFHPQAIAELEEAMAYYNECRPGLGLEFAEEVYAAIARINEFPEASTALSKNTRRCLLNRFPFGLIFQLKPDRLFIIAVANLHRRPGFWEKRK